MRDARPNRKLRTENRERNQRRTKNPLANWQPATGNSYAHCILRPIPHALINLPGKFPQLTETKQAQNQGVAAANNVNRSPADFVITGSREADSLEFGFAAE